MVRKGRAKRKLNRDIMQSAWGMLVSYLVYKCHEVVKVNPAYTSHFSVISASPDWGILGGIVA